MSKTLLFEIGTEEMPAKAAREGVNRIRAGGAALVERYRLSKSAGAEVLAYGTPRRLTLIARDLGEKQGGLVEHIKGPPAERAFGADGRPTPAALGFAKSQNTAVEALEVREIEGGKYVFAVKEEPGLPTDQVLPQLLADLAASLDFPKSMRWGSGELRFIRPIRWLLALYGKDIVPLELDGLKSGRLTYGHRFLAPGPFELADAANYEKVMAAAKVVIADDDIKARTISGMIEAQATAAGGRAAINSRVLDEVVYLVEDPHVVVGAFDKNFLKTPKDVVVTAMESHQRYFPIDGPDGNLLPVFGVVHNGDPAFNNQISHGHERVLRARLADAAFFFTEDTKTTLESKVDKLKGVVWQAKLGTLYEKMERVRLLGGRITGLLGLDDPAYRRVDRALTLAKADLTTAMVIEFTDLQGIVGREYALIDGEDVEVAEAIADHYRPRFAGDGLPQSTTGRVAALADKLDTMSGCFLAGLIPTGSADPYSLRRQAGGVVGILAETEWSLEVLELIRLAINNYAEAGVTGADPELIAKQLQDFILARLKRQLADAGADPNTVDAVLACGIGIVGHIINRVRLIDNFKGKKELEDIKPAFTRCQNLAQPDLGDSVDPGLFEMGEEGRLYEDCLRARGAMDKIMIGGRLDAAIDLLAALRAPIDNFFDAVLIMAPNENVRANRLKLLNMCLGLSRQVADFSKLP